MARIKANQKNIAYVEKRKTDKLGSSLKSTRLPGWAKKNVIIILLRKGFKLVGVPRTNL